MTGIVVLSHGAMAEGMLNSVQFLRGETKDLEALCLYPQDSTEEYDIQLRRAVSLVDKGDGVLIFTDVNGGTPANRALVLAAARPDIEVVAGVNLPLLLEALDAREYCDMEELCEQLLEVAPHSFSHASRALRQTEKAAGDSMDDLMG